MRWMLTKWTSFLWRSLRMIIFSYFFSAFTWKSRHRNLTTIFPADYAENVRPSTSIPAPKIEGKRIESYASDTGNKIISSSYELDDHWLKSRFPLEFRSFIRWRNEYSNEASNCQWFRIFKVKAEEHCDHWEGIFSKMCPPISSESSQYIWLWNRETDQNKHVIAGILGVTWVGIFINRFSTSFYIWSFIIMMNCPCFDCLPCQKAISFLAFWTKCEHRESPTNVCYR